MSSVRSDIEWYVPGANQCSQLDVAPTELTAFVYAARYKDVAPSGADPFVCVGSYKDLASAEPCVQRR
jgi:hypothetical protein